MFTLQYFCCHSYRSWQFTTLHSFATLLSLDFCQKYKHYKIQIQHRNIPLYSVTILTEAAPQRHVNTTLAKSHKFHLTLTRLARLTSAGSRKFCLRLLGCQPGCTIVYGRLKICVHYQGTGSRIFSGEKLPKLHSIPSILLNLPF